LRLAWLRLLDCEAKATALIEEVEVALPRICFVGVSVFVDDDFIHESKPHLSSGLGRSSPEGSCGFSRAEQRLLLAPLPGATDEELSQQLGIFLSTVKNVWRSIYNRSAAQLPELFPEDPRWSISQRGEETPGIAENPATRRRPGSFIAVRKGMPGYPAAWRGCKTWPCAPMSQGAGIERAEFTAKGATAALRPRGGAFFTGRPGS